jgi:hypothetical protein
MPRQGWLLCEALLMYVDVDDDDVDDEDVDDDDVDDIDDDSFL